jgi:hypothetical protein
MAHEASWLLAAQAEVLPTTVRPDELVAHNVPRAEHLAATTHAGTSICKLSVQVLAARKATNAGCWPVAALRKFLSPMFTSPPDAVSTNQSAAFCSHVGKVQLPSRPQSFVSTFVLVSHGDP